MNHKAKDKNNRKNGGSLDDEFLIRFKDVPVHMAKKIMNQEKNYRKQQILRKRRRSDLKESQYESNLSDDLSATENAGVIL